jgi:hypothetical protein
MLQCAGKRMNMNALARAQALLPAQLARVVALAVPWRTMASAHRLGDAGGTRSPAALGYALPTL